MKRLLLASAAAIVVAAPAKADLSAQIGADGIGPTLETLESIAVPTPSDQFAIGGLRFLNAIERALQTRYRFGMSGVMTETLGIPILRLPIDDNPTPDPFDPAVVEQMFADADYDLGLALEALDTIADADEVGVTIDTADLWFDINMNGARDPGEDLLNVAGMTLNRGMGGSFVPPSIRFDTADAAWLAAYAHLLSGVSEVFLAFHPAPAIARVQDAVAQMRVLDPQGEVKNDHNPYSYDDTAMFANYADLAAMVIYAIEQQPDPVLSRSALAHFQGMIADNRTFWDRVARETDNDAEWIPNKNQQSALPIAFPPETGNAWRKVLADAEGLLNGTLLIPHWRFGDAAGINLAKLMQDPPPVDIVGFVQGVSLLPYVETGRLVSADSLARFDQMMQGDAGLYMVILN